MAKRFTDTGKWDKAWFRKLPVFHKCVWLFLCDRCDHAGIWEIDSEAIAHFVGIDHAGDYDLWTCLKEFGERVVRISEDKLLIAGFIEFQYKVKIEKLNPDNKVHASVISRLESVGVIKGHASPLQGAKDKEKEKDKVKDKEKEAWVTSGVDIEALAPQIFANLPIITRDMINQKYSPGFISAGVLECVSYHLNDPAAREWQASVWGKKITTWLLEKNRREKPFNNSKPLDDVDLDKGMVS